MSQQAKCPVARRLPSSAPVGEAARLFGQAGDTARIAKLTANQRSEVPRIDADSIRWLGSRKSSN